LTPGQSLLKFQKAIFETKPQISQTSFHTTKPSVSGTIPPVKTKGELKIFLDVKQTLTDNVQTAPVTGV
jgi:hypothetical protein